MRSIMFRGALVAFLVPALVGCAAQLRSESEEAMEQTELAAGDYRLTKTRFFRIRRPRSRYARLSPADREELLRHLIEVLKTPMWREARFTLIGIGKDSIPLLIEALNREDETADELRPRPGPRYESERVFNKLGDVAWYVLKDMIANYSNYRRTGGLPERHQQDLWRRWWKRHGGIRIYGRAN